MRLDIIGNEVRDNCRDFTVKIEVIIGSRYEQKWIYAEAEILRIVRGDEVNILPGHRWAILVGYISLLTRVDSGFTFYREFLKRP